MLEPQTSKSFAEQLAEFRAKKAAEEAGPTKDPRVEAILGDVQKDITRQWNDPQNQRVMRAIDEMERIKRERGPTGTLGEALTESIPMVAGMGGAVLGPWGAAAGAGVGEMIREKIRGEEFSPTKIALNTAGGLIPGGTNTAGRVIQRGGENMWRAAAGGAERDTAKAVLSRGLGTLNKQNLKTLNNPQTFNIVPRPTAEQLRTLREEFAAGVTKAGNSNFGTNLRDAAIMGGGMGLYSPTAGFMVGGTRLLSNPLNLSRMAGQTYNLGRGIQRNAPTIEAMIRAELLALLGGGDEPGVFVASDDDQGNPAAASDWRKVPPRSNNAPFDPLAAKPVVIR